MPFFNAPQTSEEITGNGDATGYVTVTSNANYWPGARAWMSSDTLAPKEYIVTDLGTGATQVGLREVLSSEDNVKRAAGPQYGRTPLTQWLTADNARISQAPSTVRVELSNLQKVPLV